MRELVILVILRPEGALADARSYEHLGVAHLASALRAEGHTVQIIDQNLTRQSLAEVITSVIAEEPALIGISCYQNAYQPMGVFVREVKNKLPRTHITFGGVFATNSYTMILPELRELDSVVLGEAETSIVELAEAVFNGRDWTHHPHITYTGDPEILTKTPCVEKDLDRLPRPARDTLPLVQGMGLYPEVISSRGCYGRCAYCTIAAGNRQRRVRHVEAVIDEMAWLQQDFGANYVYIIDDTFIGGSRRDHERIEEFARQLMARKLNIQFSFECRANEVEPELFKLLKEAGLRSVFLGIESGYQPTLDLFQKGLRVEDNERAIKTLQKLGIQHTIGYIMFHPYTTLAEIAADMKFLLKTDQRTLLSSLKNRLLIFHNTDIARRLEQDGYTCDPWYQLKCPFFHPGIAELYDFMNQFVTEIKPAIDQIILQFNRARSSAEQATLGRQYSQICSSLVDTVFQYTENADPQFLTNRLLEMRRQITPEGGDSNDREILGS